jgi:amino acid adenylation domain-containing protein
MNTPTDLLIPEVSAPDAQYWAAAMRASADATPFPADHPGGGLGGTESTVAMDLVGDMADKLDKLTARSPFLRFVTLLAVATVVQHKYTRGLVVVTRCPARQATTGGGARTTLLPMVEPIDSSLSFQNFLLHLRDTVMQAYKYQAFALDTLPDEYPPIPASVAPIALMMRDVHEDVPGRVAPLTLTFEARDGAIQGSMHVDGRFFRRETAQRIARDFHALLARAVDNRTLTIAALCEPDDAEVAKQIADGDGGRLQLAGTVQDLFEANVVQAPDDVALVYQDQQLTYAALNRRANQLAAILRRHGVGAEVRVGLLFDRSIDMIVAILATLKAGGAYVPLEPSHPPARVRQMVEESGARVVITNEACAGAHAPMQAAVISVDRDQRAIAAEAIENVRGSVSPSMLAYLIFTSGSTGAPKCVGVTHAGLRNLVEAQIPAFGIRRGTSLLQFAPFTFDASVSEWATTLVAGGRLVLEPQEQLMPGDGLAASLRRHEIEVVTLPPSALSATSDTTCPALRTIVTAGEPCGPDLVRKWQSGRACVNAYGPTETAVCATIATSLAADGPIHIGRPILNTRAYVLDRRGGLMPLGAVGELYIGGDGVARGYVNRPDLTAERFVPDPFAREPGQRLYRTGDRVRWVDDSGTLQFQGRSDRQVKIRGYRIEPAEIEMALLGCAGVDHCAVIAREDEARGAMLVAYVVSQQRPRPAAATLRSHLQARLPEYMIPSAFVPLAQMPLTLSGKLDRARLPEPSRDLVARSEFVKPRDTLEIFLKQLWEEALGTSDISITDDFFELGGHSLKAVALTARLSSIYGARIPVRVLFDRPTVARMATFLRQDVAFSPPSAVVPLQTRGRRRPFFAAHPGSGLVQCYADMIRGLGTEQPFYAFQSRGLDADHAPLTTIEAMAAVYIEAMQTIQPRGPYQIGGVSMGALIAYEIACQLVERGEVVSLLAMLDVNAVNPPLPAGDTEAERLATWQREYLLRKASQDTSIPAEEMQGLDLDTLASRYLSATQSQGQIPIDVTLDQFRRFLSIYATNVLAQRRYRPKPYAGRVTLFRANGPNTTPDPTNGWSAYALGGIEVHEFPGRHAQFIYEPHVGELTTKLRGYLESVDPA